MLKVFLSTVVAVSMAGCCSRQPVIDFSPPAVESGDATLVESACVVGPSQGVDVCRVREGETINENIVFILPWDKTADWGELHLRYREKERVYPITSSTLIVSWKEIIGDETWQAAAEAPVQARASIRYKAADGPHWVDLLGFLFPIVLKNDYVPMAFAARDAAFATLCEVKYSSAGRSAISCKQ